MNLTLDANGNASLSINDIEVSSDDECGMASKDLDITSFTCENLGVNTVTLTVTDVNGNVTTATATVTITDDIAPTVIAQDVTLFLDENGQATLTTAQVDNGSSDNCSLTLELDEINFDCSDVGTQTVTLIGSDNSGNTASTTATVTVVDNVAPIALGKDISIALDSDGSASISASMVDNGSTDNYGTPSISIDKASFDCSNLGDNLVNLTVTDASGNATKVSVTVTVTDDIAPVVITQNATVFLDENGQASISISDIDNNSFDNCSLTLELDEINFDCSDVGTQTVTLTGSDNSGNTASATATVTVVDNVGPTALGKDVSIALDSDGSASITASMVDNGSTDNCGTPSISIDKTSFDCTNLGDNLVTLTVTDATGNATTVRVTVTVTDDIAPVVITQNASVTLDSNGQASVSINDIDNGSYDNCSLTLELDQFNFDCSDIGTQTVTLTGTDNSGNTASATAIVTVIDNATVDLNTTPYSVSLDENGQASITPADVVDEITISGKLTEYDGNSNHAVALRNYFPNDNRFIDFYFDGSNNELIEYPDGSAELFTSIINPEDDNDKWDVTLYLFNKRNWNEWSALGRSWKGNNNTVGDNFKDWSFYEMDTNPGKESKLIGRGDNEGLETQITYMPANYNYGFQIGEAANDKNGNFGMSGWVFYTNKMGQSVQGDFNLDITSTSYEIGDGPCSTAEVTIDINELDCTNLGEQTVTVTATDAYGNITTESTTVTVTDDIDPILTHLPENIVFNESGNDCGEHINWAAPNAADNCGVTLTSTHNPGDFFGIGSTDVTYTATDAAGNSVSHTFSVTVNAKPITINLDATVYNTSEGYNLSCYGSYDGYISASVDGGCGAYTYLWNDGSTTPELTDLSAGTYTVTVTDAAGNEKTESITLVQPDPLEAQISMTPNAPGGDYADEHTIYIGYGEQVVNLIADASGGNGNYTYDWSPVNSIGCSGENMATVAPQVTTTYEVQITDENGCSITEHITVNVIDVRCVDPGDGGGNNPPNDGDDDDNQDDDDDDKGKGPKGDDDDDDKDKDSDDDDDTNCQCEGKMQNFTVIYNGISGIDINVYKKDKKGLITTFHNLQRGEELKVTGFDKKGRLESKTFLQIGRKFYEIHTSCSVDILGESYGPFTVVEYTDGEGSTCSSDALDFVHVDTPEGDDDDKGSKDDDDDDKDSKKDDDDKDSKDDDDDDKDSKDDDDDDKDSKKDDDDDDDDNTKSIKGYKGSWKPGIASHKGDDDDDTSCDCEGKMQNFTVQYQGGSGAQVKVYKKDQQTVITTFNNVNNGDVLSIDGFDHKGRFDSKTFLSVNGGSMIEIHT